MYAKCHNIKLYKIINESPHILNKVNITVNFILKIFYSDLFRNRNKERELMTKLIYDTTENVKTAPLQGSERAANCKDIAITFPSTNVGHAR